LEVQRYISFVLEIRGDMVEQDEIESKAKEISKTWLTGQNSCTLIIPRETARRYQLDEPSHVVVEETPAGILIRKLDL
jgi:hypothetical protein